MTMTQNDLFCQDNCQNATQSLGQIRSWSFRSNSFSDEKKVLQIVYINNIHNLYILSLGEKIFSFLILTEMTMTGFDRNHPNYKVK